MPAPERLRRFTVRILNPIARRFAGHLPGFAIVVNLGRTSGRTYRTPVNVFLRDGDYVFALTYGSRSNGSRTSWRPVAARSRPAARRSG